MRCKSGGECTCGKGNHSVPEVQKLLLQPEKKRSFSGGFGMQGILDNLALQDEVVQVRFKGNRKAFYRIHSGSQLKRDDRVVVEMPDGFDVGTLFLVGEQASKKYHSTQPGRQVDTLGRVLRKANTADIEKWLNSRKMDRSALTQARELVHSVAEKMEIWDAEHRADGNNLVFYCAPGSERELAAIRKILSEAFQPRVVIRH